MPTMKKKLLFEIALIVTFVLCHHLYGIKIYILYYVQ